MKKKTPKKLNLQKIRLGKLTATMNTDSLVTPTTTVLLSVKDLC